MVTVRPKGAEAFPPAAQARAAQQAGPGTLCLQTRLLARSSPGMHEGVDEFPACAPAARPPVIWLVLPGPEPPVVYTAEGPLRRRALGVRAGRAGRAAGWGCIPAFPQTRR